MSKAKTTTTATPATTTRTSFKDISVAYPGISLKRLCETAGLCYQYVLKASKQPIEGEAYDAASFNYDAVQRICDKHADLDLSAFDWASVEAEALQAKSAQPRVSAVEDFTVGMEFKLREPKGTEGTPIYRVVYTTTTHVVCQYIDDTQPRVMHWDTFMHQSPRILPKEEEQA